MYYKFTLQYIYHTYLGGDGAGDGDEDECVKEAVV